MRISDWSSDVCASDLSNRRALLAEKRDGFGMAADQIFEERREPFGPRYGIIPHGALLGFSKGYRSTVTVWMASPTRPPTSVPLILIYWRSRPTEIGRAHV